MLGLVLSNSFVFVPSILYISTASCTSSVYYMSLSVLPQGEQAVRRAYRHEDLAYYIIRPGRLTNELGGLNGLVIEQGNWSISCFISFLLMFDFCMCISSELLFESSSVL